MNKMNNGEVDAVVSVVTNIVSASVMRNVEVINTKRGRLSDAVGKMYRHYLEEASGVEDTKDAMNIMHECNLMVAELEARLNTSFCTLIGWMDASINIIENNMSQKKDDKCTTVTKITQIHE